MLQHPHEHQLHIDRISGRLYSAFSLIELIAVIAIVALLAVISFTVLGAAIERNHAARCASNLRQMGVALILHSHDHEGLIPPRIEPNPDMPGLYLSGTYWHQVLRTKGYLPTHRDQSEGAHFCPTIPSKGGSEESYGMRRWRTPGMTMDISQNLGILPEPSDFFIMADSYKPATGTQGYSLGNGSSAYRLHRAHSGNVNTLFADGHVAAMPSTYFDDVVIRQRTYISGSAPYQFWPEVPES